MKIRILFLLAIYIWATCFFVLGDTKSKRIVYQIPEMNDVKVKKGVKYSVHGNSDLRMDVYYPPKLNKNKLPTVIFIMGYTDDASTKMLGVKLKDIQWYISWAELVSASGMIAITYETTQPDTDLVNLLGYLKTNSDTLKIDSTNIGVWSCSGNLPTALTILMDNRKEFIKCAVLYYGLMLTPDQKHKASIIALSKNIGFSTKGLDKIKHFHKDLPLLIVRSGKDQPVINESIDYFFQKALSENIPVTLINYTNGQHGFDAYDDNSKSREIIRETVSFLKFHLLHQE